MLNRVLSHICGRLYFPIFLLRVGFFTLMKMDSDGSGKIVPLPVHNLKSSTDVLWSVVDRWSYMGKGAFRCSMNLSPKVLADSPVYSLLNSSLLHLY